MKISNLLLLLLFQSPFACNESVEVKASSQAAGNQQKQKSNKAADANIVFKSTDGGQTWQDISEGLPNTSEDNNGVGRNAFFANDNGLWLTAGNGLYHNNPNATIASWTTAFFPDKNSSIAPGKTGMFAYNSAGRFLQKLNGTSKWLPVYTSFQQKMVRSVFESATGSIFIGSDYGLFKSANGGKTWKRVYTGGGVFNLVESTGVLMAISAIGIVRSADDGESWEFVVNEERRGFGVESIKGGFATIFYPTAKEARKVQTSYDGGKTWQSIDEGLPLNAAPTSIMQVGESFFCSHPDGIFKSTDKGKTWKLVLPSVDDKVFHLAGAGNVIYAIPRRPGC